jgi:excisionase family DNA binding protein
MMRLRLYTKREAAAQLRISARTLDRLIAAGKLSASKIGGQIRISESEIARLTTAGAPATPAIGFDGSTPVPLRAVVDLLSFVAGRDS